MDPQERIDTMNRLLSDTRAASLSTLTNHGAPFGSMTPFWWDANTGQLLIHLSRLARHTRHIDANPQVAVLITETDGPDKNPLALQRACFTGVMTKIPRDTPEYLSAKAGYLARFPTSERIFQLPDFTFYALAPEAIHLVAGFGKAYTIDPADLRCA